MGSGEVHHSAPHHCYPCDALLAMSLVGADSPVTQTGYLNFPGLSDRCRTTHTAWPRLHPLQERVALCSRNHADDGRPGCRVLGNAFQPENEESPKTGELGDDRKRLCLPVMVYSQVQPFLESLDT